MGPVDSSPRRTRLAALARRLVPEASRFPVRPRLEGRDWYLLMATRDMEAWVIHWPPGGSIELHDHGGSAAGIVVMQGRLLERSVCREGSSVRSIVTRLSPGDSLELREDHIHDIVGLGPEIATTVHLYTPRLRSMTFYSLVGDRIEPMRTVRYWEPTGDRAVMSSPSLPRA